MVCGDKGDDVPYILDVYGASGMISDLIFDDERTLSLKNLTLKKFVRYAQKQDCSVGQYDKP